MCFLSHVECRKEKDRKVLRRLLDKRKEVWEGRVREGNVGVDMIKVSYMHVWKCHNKPTILYKDYLLSGACL